MSTETELQQDAPSDNPIAKGLAAAKPLADDALDTYESAKGVIITNDSDYQLAAHELTTIKGKLRELEDRRFSMTRPIDAGKKAIMDFFKGPTQYLQDAERAIKAAISNYHQEQERKAREEQQRLQREEDARQAAAKLAREQEQAAALQLAEEAEAKGDHAGAAEMLEEAAQEPEPEPVRVPQPVVQAPKAAGVQVRDNWKHEVIDLMALAQGVVAGNIPITAIQANDKVLGQIAKATKGSMKYQGVRFYNDPIVAAGAR